MQIKNAALPDVEEWLGVDNIRSEDGILYANVTMPDSPALVTKIASFGNGVKILSPQPLIDKVKNYAKQLYELY